MEVFEGRLWFCVCVSLVPTVALMLLFFVLR